MKESTILLKATSNARNQRIILFQKQWGTIAVVAVFMDLEVNGNVKLMKQLILLLASTKPTRVTSILTAYYKIS